jgi:cyclophilin family peptidyl-prolyl cis-trans isomerase
VTISQAKTYTATFTTSCGSFEVALDARDSPNTVNSFVYLANKGFYNGLTFHRISKDADVIQGGDPKGDGSGGPGYTVKDPVPAGLQYSAGTVAMAKTGADPDGTAGSQFFVVPSGTAQIGPNYGVLGHVTSGLDVVQKISSVPIAGGSTDGPPSQPVYINSVTIVTS